MSLPSSRLESRVQALGRELLAAAQARPALSPRKTWLDRLFVALMRDESLRVQALRFVDVMPALSTDAELVSHFREYFASGAGPLPAVLKWGLARTHRTVSSLLIAPTVRQAVRTLGRRFIAGEDLAQAFRTAGKLREQGVLVSLDMLGEATLSEAEAETFARRYLEVIEALGRTQGEAISGLAAHLSIKVSALYSQLTPVDTEGSIRVLADRLRPILEAARAYEVAVLFDMEQYDSKPIVLGLFKRLFMETAFRAWPKAGIALQAYLRDTEADLTDLIDWARRRGTPVTVRLVRGAYWDQETVIARQQGWPIPVWTQKAQTDACYERSVARLLAATPSVYPAIATHNVRSIALAMAQAEAQGLAPADVEFQMLYGMAEGLRDVLVARGYPVRVYLPFGELVPGMAYLVRRLLENASSQSILRLLERTPQGRKAMLLAPPAPSPDPGKPDRPSGPVHEPVRRFTALNEREGLARAIAVARQALGRTYDLDWHQRPARDRSYLDSYNPARPAELIGRVETAGVDLVQAALDRATRALPAWSALGMASRAGYLERAARALSQARDLFAAWEILEAGKSWMEADADVAEAIDYLRYYALEARRLEQTPAWPVAGEDNTQVYAPRGVAVILPPWNFPLAILTGMLSAAIVAGNTAVLKPSSQTPVIAARFCALLTEAGLPPGVVTLLPGAGETLGEALVRDPRTHLIAFTGSKAVGLRINQLAATASAQTPHVKHVIAEMGGKNAIIIDADADLDDAVKGVVLSAFGYQGQKCSACSRLIVVGPHHDAVLARLVEAARSLPMGNPENPHHVMGPVISAAAKARIERAIEAGQAVARLVLKTDCRALGPGYYIGPTIFADVPPASPLAQEEIFGPVLAVLRARDFDEALKLANGTAYALTGGVYSRSPRHLAQARQAFAVGNLYLNRKITGAVVGRQPFGGFKLSGMGHQAGGPHYLMQFLNTRTVTENTLRRGFAPS